MSIIEFHRANVLEVERIDWTEISPNTFANAVIQAYRDQSISQKVLSRANAVVVKEPPKRTECFVCDSLLLLPFNPDKITFAERIAGMLELCVGPWKKCYTGINALSGKCMDCKLLKHQFTSGIISK